MLLSVRPKRYINIANIWVAVFVFAKRVTFVLSDWLFLAFISLKAATQISLEIITAEINPIKKLSRLILKPIRTNTINNMMILFFADIILIIALLVTIQTGFQYTISTFKKWAKIKKQ